MSEMMFFPGTTVVVTLLLLANTLPFTTKSLTKVVTLTQWQLLEISTLLTMLYRVLQNRRKLENVNVCVVN